MNKSKQLLGRIIKGIGGLYIVLFENNTYKCKARGLFRNQSIVPAVGDLVMFSIDENNNGFISEILERKNILTRPYISNIDILLITSSVVDPSPNLLLIDKLVSISVLKGITPIVVFTKSDLDIDLAISYSNIYKNSGVCSYFVSAHNGDGIATIKSAMKNKLCVLAGISGVGKSSFINELHLDINMEVGSISEKLKRGRHTTRHCEIFVVDDILIADTPGFSAVWTREYEKVVSNDIKFSFTEFAPFAKNCKYSNCNHILEKNCAVIQAVNDSKIEKSRYENYKIMYKEIEGAKSWHK